MDAASLTPLFLAASLNAVVPGPGMMLAVGRSAAFGFCAGVAVSLGMALATLIVIALVWAVMAGAVIVSDGLLEILRHAGVAVLFGLAILLLLGTTAETVARPGLMAGRLAKARLGCGRIGDVAGGLATGLSSPVHLVFLLALLPQFVDFSRIGHGELLVISAGILLFTTIPMLIASAVGAETGRIGPGLAHRVTRGSGVALLGFASFVAVSAF